MASMGVPPGMMVQQPPVVPNTHPQVQVQGAANPHGPPHPPQPHPTQQPQPMDVDPITKFKASLPRLKESLVTLFKIGGHLFYQNANQDETGIHIDKISGRFEESMEDFYATCDHIELQLRLAQEIVQQDKDSRQNTPVSVVPSKSEPTQSSEGHLYSQYIQTVRAQISCAKDIRELLHDGLHFSDHSHP